MTRKKTHPVCAKVVEVPPEGSETEESKQATTISSPMVRGAVTVHSFSGLFGETDLGALIGELQKQSRRVHDNDLRRAESMLITQAHALDAIFNELARRSAMNMGEYLDATERYMRLALKAQNQCRATLETLATVKNPPVLFAKQGNIANGPQQINNGQPNPACEKTITEQTQLSRGDDELLPDTRTSQAASRVNPPLEAMGEIDRAKVPRG